MVLKMSEKNSEITENQKRIIDLMYFITIVTGMMIIIYNLIIDLIPKLMSGF